MGENPYTIIGKFCMIHTFGEARESERVLVVDLTLASGDANHIAFKSGDLNERIIIKQG